MPDDRALPRRAAGTSRPPGREVVTPDGTRFVVRILAGADPTAAVVLVLPAMGTPARFYQPLLAALHRAGLSAASCDLRGHGESGPPVGRGIRFGYREMVEQDIPAAVAAVRAELPGAPLFLLGHSLGGQLAALGLAARPLPVRGLVLVATASVYFRCYGRLQGLRNLAVVQLIAATATAWGYWPGDRLGFAGREAAGVMRDWARQGRTGRYRLAGTATDHERLLGELRLPVLSISVDGDPLAPVAAVDHLCAKLTAARLTRWHHELSRDGAPSRTRASHGAAGGNNHFRWVRQPEALAERIAAWIGGCLPDPPRPAGSPDGHGGQSSIDELLAAALSTQVEDPYPLFDRIRAAAPVHAMPDGTVVATSYDACEQVLRGTRFGKDNQARLRQWKLVDWDAHPALGEIQGSMLQLDPPAHTRLRTAVGPAFSSAAVQRLRPAVQHHLDALLDGAIGEDVDLIERIAQPLPVLVVGELLGVPAADRLRFTALVHSLAHVLEPGCTPDELAEADANTRTVRGYFQELVADRERHPRADLTSALVHAEVDGGRLRRDEVVTMLILLYGAGVMTTVNLLGNGLAALLAAPDQLRRWRDTPGLAATAVEELLRYDSPVQLASRHPREPATLDGVRVSAGTTVLACLGAANRDPARFHRPDRLDLGRAGARPLSFGRGVHHCLGAALAHLEAEVFFRTLLDRCTVQHSGAPRRAPGLTFRGYAQLPVSLHPRRTG